MAEYPKRPPFFAAKVCKLLGRTCAAQTITPAGAYLITQIAYVEDAKRYSGPVTYFREPLMHITGIGTAARLIRVRNLCVEAGWLHYEEPPKGSRQPGVYWVTIPEKFKDLPLSPYDDEPVAQSNANEYANRTQTDTRIEREPIHESNANQHTFIPIPNPGPNPSPKNPPLSPRGDAGDEPDPELLGWIESWNNLADGGYVPHRVKDPKGSAITKGWKRFRENREVRGFLADRDAVLERIRGSPLCRKGWFRFEKLFGARNGSGALICQVLMEGGYADRDKQSTTADAGKRHGVRSW